MALSLSTRKKVSGKQEFKEFHLILNNDKKFFLDYWTELDNEDLMPCGFMEYWLKKS